MITPVTTPLLPPPVRPVDSAAARTSADASTAYRRAETIVRPVDPDIAHAPAAGRNQDRHILVDAAKDEAAAGFGAKHTGREPHGFSSVLRLPGAAWQMISQFLASPGLTIERHAPAADAYRAAASAGSPPGTGRTTNLVI